MSNKIASDLEKDNLQALERFDDLKREEDELEEEIEHIQNGKDIKALQSATEINEEQIEELEKEEKLWESR